VGAGPRDETVGRPPLRSHEHWIRRAALLTGVAAGAVILSGCTDQVERGWMPSDRGTTNQTDRIIDLWNGSWVAALAVGVLVWGLTLWCVVAYRRRRGETGLPVQVRYHLPLEILYTLVPLMMVGVLFFYTARDQSAIAATDEKPDLTINVVGKQWSWDFNYVDDDVYDTGIQAKLDGTPSPETEVPTLYLPVNKRIEFKLASRDVIHSFWIPAFLYKLDVIPGVQNKFQVVPQKIGDFKGKCAELCGEYHSEMLFNVKVVSEADYEAHVADLRSRGQTGQLGSDLDRGLTESSATGSQG